jgi:hypothetical protein
LPRLAPSCVGDEDHEESSSYPAWGQAFWSMQTLSAASYCRHLYTRREQNTNTVFTLNTGTRFCCQYSFFTSVLVLVHCDVQKNHIFTVR